MVLGGTSSIDVLTNGNQGSCTYEVLGDFTMREFRFFLHYVCLSKLWPKRHTTVNLAIRSKN